MSVQYNPLAAIFDYQLFENEEYIRLLPRGHKCPLCNMSYARFRQLRRRYL